VHLNNGTTGKRKLAANPIQVNPVNTGMFFNYSALNNTIYLVLVGNKEDPAVNISLSFYQPPRLTLDVIYDNETEVVYQNVT
jgi:hypothetical protein